MKQRRKFCLAGVAVLSLFAIFYTAVEISTSGNESSRFAVIQAVGEQNTFALENTNFNTVDKVERDGHRYSDKPLPLAWTLGMAHRAVHRATGINFGENRYLCIYLVNLVAAGLVNVLLFAWMFRQLCRVRSGRPALKLLLAAAMCLTTWLFSYSVVLNNHTPAALGVLGLLILLEKYRRVPSAALAAGAGMTAGIIGALDLPTGAFFGVAALAAIGGTAPLPGRFRALAGCAAGGGAVMLAAGLLNFSAYGTWLPLYIAGESGTFTPGTGAKNHLLYLAEVLIGQRGFFSYQPFLLLALPQLRHWRQLSIPERAVWAAAFGCMAFYILMTNEYGGAAYGFRYLIPIIPVFWYFAARTVLEWKFTFLRGVLTALLLAWGLAAAAAGVYAPFNVTFEGHRSPPGHFTRNIRSSFGGNLLVWSFDTFGPDAMLTRKLVEFYGFPDAYRYLYFSGLNQRSVELLGRIAAWGEPLREETQKQPDRESPDRLP